MRVLKFLNSREEVAVSQFDDGKTSRVMLSKGNSSRQLCVQEVLEALEKEGLIETADGRCRLLKTGRNRIKRFASVQAGDTSGGFGAQHRDDVEMRVATKGKVETVRIDINESPLARLRFRKTRDGRSWIDETAFQAGERLRADFTRGRLMQKVTQSWDIGSLGQSTGAGGKVELGDAAIDARQCLQRALESVGPDLAGVLTDVCCFLKGLECVERERKWPPRSAKLMLRTALDLLARHYGTSGHENRSAPMRSCGAEGYRPTIGG